MSIKRAHAEHLAGDPHGGEGSSGNAEMPLFHGAHDGARVGRGKKGKTEAEKHEIEDYETEVRSRGEERKEGETDDGECHADGSHDTGAPCGPTSIRQG